MIKFENTEVMGWEHAIRGCRNPMNSWDRSDSGRCEDFQCGFLDGISGHLSDNRPICPLKNAYECGLAGDYIIGPNDLDLMKRLRNAGTDHRKFMRMITVYVDITAPLYWWKEFDTYKVGTVANSCSTMHKIAAKEFTLEDFSCEHLIDIVNEEPYDCWLSIFRAVISKLNHARDLYLQTSDELKKAQESYIVVAPDAAEKALKIRELQKKKKQYWWQMIQLLPSSYNQKRTVMMNYEVLANIYKSRRNHKLDEWAEHNPMILGIDTDEGSYSLMSFCDWIKTLPYPELICGEHINKEETLPDCFVPIPKDK